MCLSGQFDISGDKINVRKETSLRLMNIWNRTPSSSFEDPLASPLFGHGKYGHDHHVVHVRERDSRHVLGAR
jgi:hypothetical protein